MRAQTGDADAGSAGLHVGMENLARLIEHLHFFLGVVVVGENIDLRNHIEGQLMGKLIDLYFLPVEHLTTLLLQFLHRSSSGTRCGLISRDADALDRR